MAKRSTESGVKEELRFVDLCAGLGGFHLALHQAAASADRRRVNLFPKNYSFRCVLASEIDKTLRELYVKNFPEITADYERLHPHQRVREIEDFQDLYDDGRLVRVHGDLRMLLDKGDRLRTWPGRPDEPIVPPHDLLCAGFPCQPFSKSGAQKGFDDLNGTVFRMIAVIIKHHSPRYVLLENVGNFERHDEGNTWRRVHEVLTHLGYDVKATTHVGSEDGGDGLLSPHHLGHPHHRERFFVVAQHITSVGRFAERRHPFPLTHRNVADGAQHLERAEREAELKLAAILSASERVAPKAEREAASVNPERVACANHWNELLARIKAHDEKAAVSGDPTLIGVPSFPIWGYELDPWNHYPIEENPAALIGNLAALRQYRATLVAELATAPWASKSATPRGDRAYLAAPSPTDADLERWVASWPRYASSRGEWPRWKQRFIRLSREWGALLWTHLDRRWLRGWMDTLLSMVPSHQKLEWNYIGGELDVWKHILQFRPSGLRVKRCAYVPALVAMTSTQVPIVPIPGAQGPARGRHILPSEGLALQGFPRTWQLPSARGDAFTALGNAVHVGLVEELALAWLFEKDGPYDREGRVLRAAEALPAVAPPLARRSMPLFAFLPELHPAPEPRAKGG